MQWRFRSIVAIALCILASIPQSARADALLPYLWVPAGQLLLFPIIVVIEAIIIRALLVGTTMQALLHSFLINIASTLIGAGLYVATGPLIGEPLYDFWWKSGLSHQRMVAGGMSIVIALVFFVISWAVEAALLLHLRRAADPRRVMLTCGVANAASYGLLLVLAIGATQGY